MISVRWVIGLLLGCWVSIGYGIEAGQIDAFGTRNAGDGTARGWGGGLGNPPTLVVSGGPDGAADYYIEVTTPPFPFHLGTRNSAQWAGDYQRECISAIEVDLNHTGGADPNFNVVYIRLVLFGEGGAFTSNIKQQVTPGVWEHHVFNISESHLVKNSFGDPNDLDLTLRNVTKLLIRHDPRDPPSPVGGHPQHFDAVLGIDNIKAVSVCPYKLPGDRNCDCIYNLLDFAETASNWLVNCWDEPVNLACEPL